MKNSKKISSDEDQPRYNTGYVMIVFLKRNDLSEKQVRQRMSHQWAEEKKISLSDYVITNDNSCLVMPQILSVHNALK